MAPLSLAGRTWIRNCALAIAVAIALVLTMRGRRAPARVELAAAPQLPAPAAIDVEEIRAQAVDWIGRGRAAEAAALLAEALTRPIANPAQARDLRFLLVDASRQAEDWPRFYDELARLEAEPAPGDPEQRELWELYRCGFPLERAAASMALGMLDLCDETLKSFDRAKCASSEPILLKLQCQLDLLAYRHERVVALVERTLAPDAGFGGSSADRLDLELRKGVALSELARMGRGDRARAREVLERVRAQFDPAQGNVERLNLELALGDLAWRDGRLEDGEQSAGAVEKLLDGAAAQERAAQAGDRAQLATLRARLALARDCDDAEASARLAELEGAFASLLERWKSVPHRKGGVGFLHPTNRRAILSELVRLEMRVHGRAQGARRALEHLMRAQALGSIARELGVGACTSADVESTLLGAGRGLLVYLPGADRSHVFAWDTGGIECVEIDPVYAIDAAYRSCGTGIATQPVADAAAARTAGDALLARAAEFAPRVLPPQIAARVRAWKSVTISGDELFDDVCFAALSVDGVGALGLERALQHVPSIPLGVALARKPRAPVDARGLELVFLAAPNPSRELPERFARLPRLELDAAGARRACGSFASERARVLVGAGATEGALRKALTPSVDVLHVMTHGVFDRGRERGQGLLLAGEGSDPGLWWLDEIDAADGWLRPPPLVLLSVCAAMRGDVRHGDDGITHTAGALLARGSRCVLTSPSDLDYAAQQELGRVVLERVDAGDAPDEALRVARRALASGDFAHPYYWATLRALGDAHSPLR
ncbi:MAG: CHAT domain-containing protein [Planctomycetota bacterium]|nr:MAG: CHAT domain-containing protein [Planctomycetota bacterium]